jgi:mRNA degradation ribonuclease J1/J2
MPDYSKGKIYKIVVDTEEQYKPYVGSSCQELSQRMTDHRENYKAWKKNKQTCCNSYDLFDRFGVENCKIILLEEYSCDSRMKLLMKEREWFDKMECCNKCRPYISKEERINYNKELCNQNMEQIIKYKKEWYESNKEHVSERGKIYRDEHKEELAEKKKEYAQINKEKIAEKAKEWREANKEQIAEKGKEKFECNCGSICRLSDKSRHERSLKHQEYLSSLKV